MATTAALATGRQIEIVAFPKRSCPAAVRIVYTDTGAKTPFSLALYPTQAVAEAALPAVVAEQDNADAHSTTRPATSTGAYTTTSHGIFGEGRVHQGQPGATQYDDGAGTFGVQIWDN